MKEKGAVFTSWKHWDVRAAIRACSIRRDGPCTYVKRVLAKRPIEEDEETSAPTNSDWLSVENIKPDPVHFKEDMESLGRDTEAKKAYAISYFNNTFALMNVKSIFQSFFFSILT